MGINIYHSKDQANGDFNYGEILEKKPIGFLNEGGVLKPYSNIFYWAHAWTPGKKSTIGLHPHQGFEICSFVLSGKINHFDTQQNKWISLSEGDVQIIRAGNGISHAEEIDEKSEIFQIWFDPDLKKTLNEKASYDDYKLKDFKEILYKNKRIRIIKGEQSPMKMNSEGVLINQYFFNSGSHSFQINHGSIHSFFILSGTLKRREDIFEKGTFFTLDNIEDIEFIASKGASIFEIITPLEPSYETYAKIY
jgi:redox-sensitive bicupin YhaK (pirin superfamily)